MSCDKWFVAGHLFYWVVDIVTLLLLCPVTKQTTTQFPIANAIFYCNYLFNITAKKSITAIFALVTWATAFIRLFRGTVVLWSNFDIRKWTSAIISYLILTTCYIAINCLSAILLHYKMPPNDFSKTISAFL